MAARPRRIIVGYDGSDASGRALVAAADLVGYGSTLAVVTVHTREPNGSTTAMAREELLRRHVEARYHELGGEPAEALLEKAEELEADLIVIGRRNGGALPAPIGSVSSKIVRDAPCDVLVVR
jgi:nucleotide-binding universal stress UspA family protein